MNGFDSVIGFDPNLPINIPEETKMGISARNLFVSEFGCNGMSSFESMSSTLSSNHWSLHGGTKPDVCLPGFERKCSGNNPMAERNYPCDNIIDVYFGKQNLDEVGEYAFKKQLYLCMLGQALFMKSNIETRRAKNELGCLGMLLLVSTKDSGTHSVAIQRNLADRWLGLC